MGITHGVSRAMFRFAVLRTIEFDNQLGSEADEIENIAVRRRLPAEMMALCAQASQMRPDLRLVRRHPLAERAGEIFAHLVMCAGAYAAFALRAAIASAKRSNR